MKRRWGIGVILLGLILAGAGWRRRKVGRACRNLPARWTTARNTSFTICTIWCAGETVYAYAEADGSELDTYLLLGDIDFGETFAEDDDSGGGTNSALEYRVPENGDYSLAVTRYNADSAGDFRLLIGIDAPDVLAGSAGLPATRSPSTGARPRPKAAKAPAPAG